MKKQIKVKANAKRESLTELPDGTLLVTLTAPPVEGKANRALIKLLAKTYGIPQGAIAIQSGHHSKIKIVQWPDPA